MKSGQMIPKGPGKWLLRVFLGSEMVNGKRIRKYSSKAFEGTTAQARNALTKMQHEVNTETFVVPSKRTLKEYLQAWLDSKVNIAAKTKLDYQHRLDKDVYPFLGGLQLSQLGPEHLRVLYGKLQTERDLSPRSIRYTHSILSGALATAVEDGLLVRNPCDRKSVKDALPKKTETEPAILTPEQVVTVVDGEPDVQLRALWRLLLLSAMRPQEALVLKWTDLEDGAFRIRRTISEGEKGAEFVKDFGKTAGALRSIDLDEETLSILQEHRTVQLKAILKAGEKHTRQGYVFSTRTGEHLARNNVRKYWKRALTRHGFPELKLYTTRHTHLSSLYAQGMNPKAIAERAGHTDPAMGLRVYAHTLPGAGKELARAAAGILKRKAQ